MCVCVCVCVCVQPEWSRLTAVRAGSRTRSITIDDDDYDDDDGYDEQDENGRPDVEQDGETAAMVAARQTSAITQKAMEDALAASAVRTPHSEVAFPLDSLLLWTITLTAGSTPSLISNRGSDVQLGRRRPWRRQTLRIYHPPLR
eukprot:COSAG02_NODE_5291_length_4468_cov_358.403525_6_plen_145_part_00